MPLFSPNSRANGHSDLIWKVSCTPEATSR